MSESAVQRVAANVRAEAARKRVTNETLREVMGGVSQKTLARRLAGELEFTALELQAVADVLGVPVSRLLGEEVRAS